MKKLNKAFTEYYQLMTEGYEPKLLWDIKNKSYYVSVIWVEVNYYERLL